MSTIRRHHPGGNYYDPGHADVECTRTYYERRAKTEDELLELIFAENGKVHEAIRLATAQGVDDSSWLGDEHLWLWRIAVHAPSTAVARRAAQMSQGHQVIVISVRDLLAAWFWSPPRITHTAQILMRMIAAEREARLCARRYVGLLDGSIAPTMNRTERAA